jgi:hypothetical protein
MSPTVHVEMPSTAAQWLATGERGISSEAILSTLTGLPMKSAHGFGNHPHDPDDFKRCEMLLRAVPEFRERLGEMAAVSPVWAGLVARWDEIAALAELEIPGLFEGRQGSAPLTYMLMRKIIEAGEER